MRIYGKQIAGQVSTVEKMKFVVSGQSRTREYCPDTIFNVGSYLSKATIINPWTRVTARNENVQTLILMLRTRSWIAFGGPQGCPGLEHSNRQIKESVPAEIETSLGTLTKGRCNAR